MKRTAAAIWLAATLALAPTAVAHPRPARGDCNSEGSCEDQRRCSGNEGDCQDNHKSFSPTFDKSPVDHSFNFTVCVMPGSCPPDKGQPPPQKAAATGCLVFVPFHCDPHPKGTT